jgi:hypothetical protein
MKHGAKSGQAGYLTGYLLVSLIAIILIICSLTFLLGATLSWWQFPAALVCSGLLTFAVSRDQNAASPEFWKALILSSIIIVLSIVVATFFYDVSYDGQAYHQETLIQLRDGWNPFFEKLPDSVNQVLYINHYAKGGELASASIYTFIGKIESGKAINLILFAGAFALTLSLLCRITSLTLWKAVLITSLVSLNPICLNQLLSYYVDGLLATALLCLFVTAIFVIIDPNRFNFILLGLISVTTANIKFTSVVYVVLFLGFFCVWIFFNKKPFLKNTIITCLASAVIGVLLVGYNPYVINTVKYKHPFYPVMGAKKADILTYNFPLGFEKKSMTGKLFTSLFAHTSNPTIDNGIDVNLKIPFTFNKEDIASASKIDARIGGFGPVFSGILLLSCLMLVLLLIYAKIDSLLKNVLYIILSIMVSVMILPESWWARYIPQLWFFPILILLASELKIVKYNRILSYILYASIILNIGFSSIGIGWNFLMTSLVNYQMETMKNAGKPVIVHLGSAASNRIRFEEKGVPYIEKNLDGIAADDVIRSDSRVIIPASPNVLKKSIFVTWGEKFIKAKQ